jgi:hypothetical protein
VVLREAGDRLSVAVQLDGRQSARIDVACGLMGQIIALGHAESAELARLALMHLVRSKEPDRLRDQHVLICLSLTRLGRRAVGAIGRTIERATVGRSRPDEEEVSH